MFLELALPMPALRVTREFFYGAPADLADPHLAMQSRYHEQQTAKQEPDNERDRFAHVSFIC